MSYCLYIGTDVRVRSIPWDESAPDFHTRNLREEEWPIAMRFRKSYQTYVGSDQGDGRGFRHVGLVDGAWSETPAAGAENPDVGAEQPNHEKLQALLEDVLSQSDEVELYLCRDGDCMRPSAKCAIIPVEVILDRGFHFSERCAYTVVSLLKKCSAK